MQVLERSAPLVTPSRCSPNGSTPTMRLVHTDRIGTVLPAGGLVFVVFANGKGDPVGEQVERDAEKAFSACKPLT